MNVYPFINIFICIYYVFEYRSHRVHCYNCLYIVYCSRTLVIFTHPSLPPDMGILRALADLLRSRNASPPCRQAGNGKTCIYREECYEVKRIKLRSGYGMTYIETNPSMCGLRAGSTHNHLSSPSRTTILRRWWF